MNYRVSHTKLYLLISVLCIPFFGIKAQEVPYVKMFFEISMMPNSYYNSTASYTGKSWIKHVQTKLTVSETYNFTPKNALELQYLSSDEDNWTATIQYDKIRGIDFFQPATHLSFWMYLKDVDALN